MKVQSLSRTNFKGYSNVISLINAPIDDKSISYIAMKLDNNGEKDLDKYIEIQKMQNQYKGSADDILSFAYSYNKRTGLDMFYFQGKPMFFGSELLYLEENFVPRAISKKDYKTASQKISSSIATSLFIVIPCAVGFITLADPILKMLYPNASDGALVLQIASITMILVAVNHTLQGSLFGLGRMYVPALALLCGSGVKILLNLVLISNPKINMYGAPISSFVCQLITFLIVFITLKKSISFKVDIKKSVLKPVISSMTMAISILLFRYLLKDMFGNTILTILSILVGVIVYAILIIKLKVFTKEEILGFPGGKKIYSILTKLKLYA